MEKEIPKINQDPKPIKKMRKIIIETDGNSVNIVSAEVSGSLELCAVMQAIINSLNKNA